MRRIQGRPWRTVALAAATAAWTAPAMTAQVAPVPTAPQRSGVALVPGDTVLATPDSRFEAGALHRWVLGDGWRELWGLPVPAAVLDLERFAGGLTPTGLGGGLQTLSLRLEGADGRTYNFRSLDKDATRALDPILRETLAADLAQDRIGAIFPLNALVVTPLLDAAGVFHPDPRLVVMPDDARLGEFRDRFAGLLGWIEERPDELEDGTPGFRGSRRVVGSERLLERLEEGPDDRVDAAAFLRARLIDFLVADWDRHPDQWRWAGFEEDGVLVFEPVPRDRDWALSRLDGVVATISRFPWPHYIGLSEEYGSAFRLSWSGRALDRRILPALEWEVWEQVVEDLMDRIDGSVVRAAVRRLPDSYYERVGAWMTGALLQRRERLPDVAREFYRLLADEVDIHATDAEELARVERLPDGSVRVTLRRIEGDETGPPYFERTFRPDETSEIRIDLRGDDDRVEVVGVDEGPIDLHIDGGGSDDVFVDRTSGKGVTFYSDRGDDVFETRGGAKIDRRRWEEPIDPDENTHRAGYRSWGVRWLPVPLVEFSPDVGLFVGGGARRTAYGFRHHPYESLVEARVGVGTATQRPRADLVVDIPGPFRTRATAQFFIDDAEEDRFYGFGNGTRSDGPDESFEAPRSHVSAGVGLRGSAGERLELGAGVAIDARRELDAGGTLVDELDPYGWGDFEQVGLTTTLTWSALPDAFDEPGVRFDVSGHFSPSLLDVEEAFGSAAATGVGRLVGGGPLQPTLALRVGAEKVWGTFPVHDAAYLGGGGSLRGFRNERFAGDASVHVGSEVRVRLSDLVLILPGEFGLLGLADGGRVFGGDEESGRWHSAAGGGLWMRWVEEYTLSVAVARSDELTGVYVALGFPF